MTDLHNQNDHLAAIDFAYRTPVPVTNTDAATD